MRMQPGGPLSCAASQGAIFCTWNPPYPLGLITTHMPPVISAGHTLLFDSRMWTDSRGVRWLSESHNGNSRNDVRRRKPRVERGAACSMLLSIDRTTHVHVSVRSVRRARGSSGSHGHREPLSMAIVLLLCCGAPSDNFTMHNMFTYRKVMHACALGDMCATLPVAPL